MPVSTPFQMQAGTTYRIAVYSAGQAYYGILSGLPRTSPLGTIGQEYYVSGDGFPTTPGSSDLWFVDVLAQVGVGLSPVPITPTTANFTNGVWTGNVTVTQAATGMYLNVDDGAGHISSSNVFNVGAETVPTATVSLGTHTPLTNDVLTATATKSDADGDPVSLTYVWQVNGVTKRTFTSATALTDTFDLGLPGNGDRGDTITVEVTPTDGILNGTTVTDTAVVADTAPVATVSLNTHVPRTNGVLTATATTSDADGDPVSLTFVWEVNGTIKQTDASVTTLTDAFDLGQLGSVEPGDVITVAVTPNDGMLNGATVTDSGTVVAMTRIWDGGGIDNNWTTAANWADDIVPVPGDRLEFAGTTQTSSNNDFPAGTTFDSITFDNGGFTLSGNAVTLDPQSGVAIDNILGYNQIALPLALASAAGLTTVRAGELELGSSAQSPVLAGGGADIQAGSLVFDYSGSSPAAAIQTALTTSYAGGAWNVGPFTTDAATGLTLGWTDDGAGTVTVMATLPGDANLDGTVGVADLNALISHYGKASTWAQGDFGYDGTVGFNDLIELISNYGRLLSAMSSKTVVAAPLSSANMASPIANNDAKVKSAMNDINAAQREQVAANARGEAEKILVVKKAEAEAESKALQGQGIANQRRAIIEGLQTSVEQFQKAVQGASSMEVMQLVLVTQYFDTLKSIGESDKTSTLFLAHSPSAVKDVSNQIMESMLVAGRAINS